MKGSNFVEGNWSNYWELCLKDRFLDIRYYPNGSPYTNQPIQMWIGDGEVAPTFRGFRTIEDWKEFVKVVMAADRELNKLLNDG